MRPRGAPTHTQGVPLRSSGIGPTGRLETALPGGDWKSPLLAKNTGRVKRPSQSARETRRSKRRPEGRRSQSAPRTTPLLPGVRHDPTRNWAGMVHQRRPPRCRCPTTRVPTGPGGGATARPGNDATPEGTRSAPTVIEEVKLLRSPPPPGLRHDPTRNWARMVHQRRPPRCRCPTTRSLLGRGVARRLGRGTMRPRRAPTRSAPTVIGN